MRAAETGAGILVDGLDAWASAMFLGLLRPPLGLPGFYLVQPGSPCALPRARWISVPFSCKVVQGEVQPKVLVHVRALVLHGEGQLRREALRLSILEKARKRENESSGFFAHASSSSSVRLREDLAECATRRRRILLLFNALPSSPGAASRRSNHSTRRCSKFVAGSLHPRAPGRP